MLKIRCCDRYMDGQKKLRANDVVDRKWHILRIVHILAFLKLHLNIRILCNFTALGTLTKCVALSIVEWKSLDGCLLSQEPSRLFLPDIENEIFSHDDGNKCGGISIRMNEWMGLGWMMIRQGWMWWCAEGVLDWNNDMISFSVWRCLWSFESNWVFSKRGEQC